MQQRRIFKECFSKFLMIFLAVTPGFFAEQMRKNIPEKMQKNMIKLPKAL